MSERKNQFENRQKAKELLMGANNLITTTSKP